MSRTTLKPGPFSAMKMLMPRRGGSAFGSVLATRAKVLPWRPLVIRLFAPFTTYSSPSRTARVSMAWTSLPALGSVMQMPPRFSPVAIRGRNRSFCSGVPWVVTM